MSIQAAAKSVMLIEVCATKRKTMKKHILIIIALLVLSVSVFSQAVPIILTGNESPKELKELEKRTKEAEKKERKEQEQRQKQIKKADDKSRNNRFSQLDIDVDDLALFPQSYVGKTVRVKSLFLSELEPQADGADTVYFVKALSRSGASFNSFATTNKLTFVVSESMARELLTYYKKYSGGFLESYPGHIIFEVVKFISPNGSTFYFGKITCAQMVSLVGFKIATLGNCQI